MVCLGFKFCHDILLLLNMADMDRWKTGVSNAEYLSACREFCGVHSLQNCTRCRDGLKVFWCRSHLVWLVLRVPSQHALVKTFCDLLLLLFWYCCLGMEREKRGGRGGRGEDAQSI